MNLRSPLMLRRAGLAAALAVTLVLSFYGGEEGGTVQPARAEHVPRPVPEASAKRAVTPARDQAAGGGAPPATHEARTAVDAFEVRSWAPPPPPEHNEPVAPQAPPLPYSYIGKIMEQDGQITVFIDRQDRNYVVHQGDTLDGQYHVDEVTSTAMTVTYLPLNQRQTLSIGSAE